MTNNDLVIRFMDNFHNRFSDNTLQTYHLAIVKFLDTVKKDATEIVKSDVTGCLSGLLDKGLQPATVKLNLAALRNFFNFCVIEGFAEKNPTIGIKVLR